MTHSCGAHSPALTSVLLALLLGGPVLASEIVGGRPARPHAWWPFMVSLQRRGGHFCGATLIARNSVVSAAHRVKGLNFRSVQVVLGAHDLRQLEPSRQVFSVQRVSENGFDATRPLEDLVMGDGPGPSRALALPSLALYRSPAPGSFSKQVSAWVSSPCLLEGGQWQRDPALVAPWGVVTMSSPQGDSGGPLVCNGLVQGMDSFIRRGCGSGLYPDAFAPVAEFADWINSVIHSPTDGPLPHPGDPDTPSSRQRREVPRRWGQLPSLCPRPQCPLSGTFPLC
uniref:Peptidase S1 domain-containing protein n=1 Tax=Spermophilus dauricus TaxID=99837 RepID=A0A8C9P9D3_SPEDA